MDDLEFHIKDFRYTKDQALVTLEVINVSDHDINIRRDSLLLDGFTSDKFTVILHGKDLDIQIPYRGKFVKYLPDLITIKAHDSLINALNLAEEYQVQEAVKGDVITIFYYSPVDFYNTEECQTLCIGEFHDQFDFKIE